MPEGGYLPTLLGTPPETWRAQARIGRFDKADVKLWEASIPEAKLVTIYTRGVCSPSGTGGYGAVLICADRRKELSGSAPDSSNNRMDILAAVESLRALRLPCCVALYNTNTYLTDAISKGWAVRWRANGWRNSERR